MKAKRGRIAYFADAASLPMLILTSGEQRDQHSLASPRCLKYITLYYMIQETHALCGLKFLPEEDSVMKTFTWSFAFGAVFFVVGALVATGAALDIGSLTWRFGEEAQLMKFPDPVFRGVAGGAGLLLAVLGLAGLIMTWREYQCEKRRTNSVWRKFCR